ncbi:MAG: alpha-mannosidase, partial [Calditrichaeota bacterium]
FFHRLEKQARDFPVWWGELYFEYHRGTLTTHAEIKRWNRKCEFLLREAEFFISLSQWLAPATTEQPAWPQDLHTAWQKLLLNQFHDILPGSSILEVYDQALSDYRDIAETCERLISRATAQFLPVAQKAPAHALAIFNALNWERTEPVEIFLPTTAEEVAIFDSQHRPVPKQVLQKTPSGQRLLIQPQVPATGYETLTVLEQKNRQPDSSLKVSQRAMENRWFRLRLNANGQILSLWDKQQAREVMAPGEKGNVLETYEDLPANWEAWDIDADYVYKPLSLFRCREVKVEETGPLRAAVRFTHRSENSTISQRIVLYEALPRIDFETEVDWHEQRVLLKVAFPVAVLSPHATYEIQFGALERTTHTNTSWDAARFEVVGHKWADLSEGDYGVSLLNDCKYGYDVRDHRLRLTLLRSPFPPDPLVAGPHVDYRQATDQGTHRFVYSLYPHAGNWRQAQTVRRAYELNLPLRCMPLDHRKKLSQPPRFSFLSVDQSNIIMEVLKPAFDGPGIILRLYESSGQRGRCQLRIAPFPQKIELCDLLENPIRAISCQPDRCQIEYAPFEILTLKLSYGSSD